MAFSLRRIFSSTTLVRPRHLSYIFSSNPFNSVAQTPVFGTNGASNYIGFEFLNQSRRGFAIGKNSKDDGGSTAEIVPDVGPTVSASPGMLEDDGGSTVEIVPDVGPSVTVSTVSLMEAAIGRASPGMLDHIIVETGGMKMPLSRIAVVSVPDSKILSVTPYDPKNNEDQTLDSASMMAMLWEYE